MVISSILTPGACSRQLVEVESIRNLLKSHGIGQVLFVGHDEQAAVPQLILRHEPAQLISALLHPVSVVAVHHKYDHVCVLVVVTPQWTLQQELDDVVNDRLEKAIKLQVTTAIYNRFILNSGRIMHSQFYLFHRHPMQ